MKIKLRKFLTILIILCILSSWLMCMFIEQPVYAKPSETTPRTGHTQEEAGETIAAWAIHFKELHEQQMNYLADFSESSPRVTTYNLPVSDNDLTTQYTSDCNGFVSFVIHHALGIGGDTFVRFASPGGGTGDVDCFEYIGGTYDTCKPGDILTFQGHVALYAGDGNSIGLYATHNIWHGPAVEEPNNGPSIGSFTGALRIKPEVAASANFAYLEGAGLGGTAFSMKGTKVSDCARNELHSAAGGQPGDQDTEEYSVKDWYDFGQTYVLRHPNLEVAATIAQISILAANNDAIGYCQPHRLTYWEQLQKFNFEPDKITTPCEADCSSSTSANVKVAGQKLNNEQLKSLSEDSYTGNLKERLEAIGFQALTDPKYFSGPEELLAGDILLNELKHVNVFVGNGAMGSVMNYDIDPITVNLDEQLFQYSGAPKTVMYSGTNNLGEWLFNLFSQFKDFIVSVIANGIKNSILGYVMTAEGAVDSAIKYLDGNQ